MGDVEGRRKQDLSNGGSEVFHLGSNPLKKKKKRKRDLDAAEPVVGERRNPPGGVVMNDNMRVGDSDVPRPSVKKKKRKRDLDAAESVVGERRNPAGGVVMNDDMGIGDFDVPGPSVKKKKRKRDLDAAEPVVGERRNPAGGVVMNDDMGVGDSDVPGPSVKKKKKKSRKEDSEKSFPDVDIRQNAYGNGVVRDKKDSKGYSECSVLEVPEPGIPPVKEKQKMKKKVRFQEPCEDVIEENISHVSREAGIDNDIAYFSEVRNWKKDLARDDLFYGKFTKEEDEKIKSSVHNYVKMRGWDANEGLQTVLFSSLHPDARGCWLDIAKCLPNRPVKQINARAHRLLGGGKRGEWSPDELEMLKELHNVYGTDWKKIAAFMDRSGQLCKDKWRHLRLAPTLKKGSWTQDELDKLCKLVRRSLRLKELIPPGKKSRRLLRDDINWDRIAEEMQRDSSRCADIWYLKLASPMISNHRWDNGDDSRLLQSYSHTRKKVFLNPFVALDSLMDLGASSEDAVDWDNVLDHRDGETCMERWMEMTKPLGGSSHVSFEDKVEMLAKRYSPDLLGIEEES